MPVAVLTAQPAEAAVTCGVYKWKLGAWEQWRSIPTQASPDPDFDIRGKVWYRNCTESDGTPFVKVHEYHVIVDHVGGYNGCSNIDEWIVNPNVLSWWNPGTKTYGCSATYPLMDMVFHPDSSCVCVNIYASLPSNEKCIGADITAGISGAPDDYEAVPTICFLPSN